MTNNLARMKHLVVVMLENRSFDNLLGFLYASDLNRPPRNLPAQDPPTFEGLLPNQFWNPTSDGQEIFASTPTTGLSPFTVPTPDPNELFANMTFQLFGSLHPADEERATMVGFYADFLKIQGVDAASGRQIMQSYAPSQAPVLSSLALNYAVCDHWFASVPAQTWPNRAFIHTGTSQGEVTNGNVFAYSTKTIYEVLEESGVSWTVYNDGEFMSLTRIQYPHLLNEDQSHFRGLDAFKDDAAHDALPTYAFVEPRFNFDPNDQHPPHDIRAGEQFLFDIWTAVVTSPGWNETVLVITYDEHGGCYDHVAPPWGAAVPDDRSNPGQQGFRFDRFGVRVPAVVVSPFIEAGTVFRSSTGVPYDHASILATIRSWLSIPPGAMLPSRRIAAAPTLEQLLTRDTPRTDRPNIQSIAMAPARAAAIQDLEPLNHLQQSMVIATEMTRRRRTLTSAEADALLRVVSTKGTLRQHLTAHGYARK